MRRIIDPQSKNNLRLILKKILRHFFNLDIRNYKYSDDYRLYHLLEHYGIDVVIDIGANQGQYATELRNIGYQNHIGSIEPLESMYRILQEKSSHDPNWSAHRYAIGRNDGETIINVAESSVFSSILPSHNESVKYVEQQVLPMRKLDTLLPEIVPPDAKATYVKIDTQGYEQAILDGAAESLSKITGLQLEMSIERMYDGEILFQEMIEYLYGKGFELCSIEPGHANYSTGKLKQFDGIFFRQR